ncbi:cell wall integrity and stress response component [Microdochium nivale]|nr:cell wall integrity and stress response component [Microdochium nivale]
MKISSVYALVPLAALVAADTTPGCYSSLDNAATVFTEASGSNIYLSQGLCRDRCMAQTSGQVAAIKGGACYCGSRFPPEADQVALDQCNTPCPGYPIEMCGGSDAYTVFSTGQGSGGSSSGTSQGVVSASAIPSTAAQGIPIASFSDYSATALPSSTIGGSATIAPTTIPTAGANSARDGRVDAMAAAMGLGVIYNLL